MSGPLRLALIGGLALAATAATAANGKPAAPSTAFAEQSLGRVAIETLIDEYEFRLDHDQNDRLAELFVPAGTFDMKDTGTRLVGRTQIADYYAKRSGLGRTTRHVTTNLHLIFDKPDHAHGLRTVFYFAGAGAPPLSPAPRGVLDYEESYARGRDGRWLFESRVAEGVFGSAPPAATAAPAK